jgi:hypothetical protein
MRSFLPALPFLLLISPAAGQYYSTGQDPASTRWRQIRTDRYKLIFPASFEPKAQYLANIMDIVCRNETATLQSRVPRLPLILHTRSVLSNGVTVWAPRRIELYTCPPQDTYAEEWLEQLAIHEYRHAVQISKINRGFSKALYYIFGEQITGGILGLYVPSWFLEGDATVTETAMTNTGRGRSALFESTLRAQIVEKGPYSYDKATLGSYRTFIPNAYSLGYYLAGQARATYGTELWNTALDRVAKYPFMAVPFNSGIRKVTGMWKTTLYRETLEELDSAWRRQLYLTEPGPARFITRRDPRNYSDYHHPVFRDDSTILTLKTCMDDVARFVLIDAGSGEEKRLLTPGSRIDNSFSAGGDYLVWTEMKNDLRWSNRDFSCIMIYNFRTGKKMSLTRKTRTFAPALSPDGSRLAAVSISEENLCFIDMLQIPDGQLIKRWPVPAGQQARKPSWSPDARLIIFYLLTPEGETIATLDLQSGKISALLPPSNDEFNGHPVFWRQYIMYSNDRSGIENIYALDTVSLQSFHVSSGRFATYDPFFTRDGRKMIFSDYTSDGLMVSEMTVDTPAWLPAKRIANHAYDLAGRLAGQEHANIQDSVFLRNLYKMNSTVIQVPVEDKIEGKIYPSGKYSRILNLFNPHSWAPLSLDLGNLDINPGVMVLSQNALSSMFAGMGWQYDLNEQTGRFYANVSYRGWYPAIDFRFDIGNRASYTHYHGSSDTYRFTWQETNLKAAVSVPLNLSQGRYTRTLKPFIGTTLIGIRHHDSTPQSFTDGWIQTMDFGLSFSQYLNSDQKDVYPRLGQSANLLYRDTPFGNNDMGSIFGVNVNLYFPGFFRHHGIWMYGGYQGRWGGDDLSYSYADIIPYPRGYSGEYDEQLVSLKANYKLPLWYPDYSAGSVLYLKRLKINLFYDRAYGKNPGYFNDYESAGCELTADFHVLRFVAPFEMGVRSIWFPMDGSWGFEFLYAISY